MTINTYRKGNRVQQKCKRYYESLGYEVEVTQRNIYRGHQDFFGLWDLICIGRDIRLVQVKANNTAPREWMERAAAFIVPAGCIKELVIYKDYQRGEKPSRTLTL